MGLWWFCSHTEPVLQEGSSGAEEVPFLCFLATSILSERSQRVLFPLSLSLSPLCVFLHLFYVSLFLSWFRLPFQMLKWGLPAPTTWSPSRKAAFEPFRVERQQTVSGRVGIFFSPGWPSPSWKGQQSLPGTPCYEWFLVLAVARLVASGVLIGFAWLELTQDVVEGQGISWGCPHPSVGRMLWRRIPSLGLLTFSSQLLFSQTLGTMGVNGHHRVCPPTGPGLLSHTRGTRLSLGLGIWGRWHTSEAQSGTTVQM